MRVWLTRGYSLQEIGVAVQAALPDDEVLVGAGRDTPPGPCPVVIEPDPIDAAGYLDFLRRTVATRGIDVLVPTRRAALVEAASGSIGCRVEAASSRLDTLHDKLAFAAALAGDPLLARTLAVRGADDFERGIAEFAARGTAACVKPARGVNGIGYLRFTDRPRLAQLAEPELRETRPDTFALALRDAERDAADGAVRNARRGEGQPAYLLMEYLPGDEISVDTLAWRGRLLGRAARTKRADGVQALDTRHALEPDVRRLVERFDLHGLVSVQFRRDAHGAPKLLEINPRPAGGCTFAEAAGCGLVRDWARLLAGRIAPADVRVPHVRAELRRDERVTVVPADAVGDGAGTGDDRCAA